MSEHITIYADSSRGQYIPQFFAQSIKRDKLTGVSAEDLAILEAGPEQEHYWDVWTLVLDNASVRDDEGWDWNFIQTGDLFMVRADCPDEDVEALLGV